MESTHVLAAEDALIIPFVGKNVTVWILRLTKSIVAAFIAARRIHAQYYVMLAESRSPAIM